MKSTRAQVLVAGLTIGFGFGSPLSHAVSLGDMTLNSAANEALDATIQLHQLDGVDERDISITIASAPDSEQAGIARDPLLDDIDFAIEIIDAENALLHLSSTEPVTASSLSFLLDARWPAGRMTREYSVSIANADINSTAIDADGAQSPSAVATSSSSAIPSSGPSSTEPAAVQAVEPLRSENTEYLVTGSDTLWEIAALNRAGDVSVQQAMVAIQRANPNAFANANINSLFRDAVLRIPTVDEMRAVDSTEAIMQVAQQNQRYLAAGGSIGAAGELRVLTAEEVEAARAESASLAEEIASLEMQLMVSEEAFDRASFENQELQSRLAEMNSQIELLDNIIAIEDERLSAVQSELAAEAAAEQASQQDLAENANDSAEPPLVSDETLLAADADVAPEPSPAVIQVNSSSLQQRIMTLLQNTYVLLGAGIVLVALVIGFLVTRRKRGEQSEEPLNVFDEPRSAPVGGLAAKDEKAAPKPVAESSEDEFDLTSLSMDEDDAEFVDPDDELPNEQGLGEYNASSRINLAVAYEATGDRQAARDILNSILEDGDLEDQVEARKLLAEWQGK